MRFRDGRLPDIAEDDYITPKLPEETVPLWIGIILIAILSISMFVAGFLLGTRYESTDDLTFGFGDVGYFTFQADSGDLRANDR